ncbi:UvrD-helicase domain-containing protein [Microbacterium oxydans]|nr:UvrD-helicase domain-containing protein [Microbacterium oxydans]
MIEPTPAQASIRDASAPDLLVVAPAGCGKTEALALRVQGLLARGDVASPRKVLVTTFESGARQHPGAYAALPPCGKFARSRHGDQFPWFGIEVDPLPTETS